MVQNFSLSCSVFRACLRSGGSETASLDRERGDNRLPDAVRYPIRQTDGKEKKQEIPAAGNAGSVVSFYDALFRFCGTRRVALSIFLRVPGGLLP